MEHVYYLIYVERPDTSVCIVTDNALIVPMRTALVTPFCPSFYCPPAVSMFVLPTLPLPRDAGAGRCVQTGGPEDNACLTTTS